MADPYEFIRMMEVFKQISPDIQASTVLTFMYVARRGRAYQKDIEMELGLSNAAASRNVAYWTKVKHDRSPGVDFIERMEDTDDRRNKVLVLNERGREFYERLRRLVYVRKDEGAEFPSGRAA
jgi:DNA-binding MarR family transcriptional regulator